MASTNFNMRLDSDFKNELSQVLANYGLTIPQAFKLFGNQVIKTRKVPLTFDWENTQDETLELSDLELSDKAKARLRQTEKELVNGEYSVYSTAEDALIAMQQLAK